MAQNFPLLHRLTTPQTIAWLIAIGTALWLFGIGAMAKEVHRLKKLKK